MATIIVEGIPDALLARLRLAAADSGRSLNSEVIVQLARTLGRSPGSGAAGGALPAPGCGSDSGCRCHARRAEERAAGWGGPAAAGPP